MGVAVVLLANVFFGGGKCLNLGVVNVRILGVVNVLLANDSQLIYVRNELEICMKIYNRGNAKYYYIDNFVSLIFSPEKTIATLSLLSQLNIKIDSGFELSLVEGLV